MVNVGGGVPPATWNLRSCRSNFSGSLGRPSETASHSHLRFQRGKSMRVISNCFQNQCTRRDFLKVGALAFAGLDLPKLLAADHKRREISCIVFFQNGGASQLDTFDPKPEAPSDVRGSFKSIPTSVPGVHISELLPRTAQVMKKFSIIRSMHSDEAIHERARQYIFSGTKPRNELLQPSYGAVMAKERGPQNGLPAFVVIPENDVSAEAGFLGPSFNPFVAGDPNTKT